MFDELLEFVDGRIDFGLRPGLTDAEIDAAETELTFRLPEDVRELYRTHDGQDERSPGFWFGCPFDPLDVAIRNLESAQDNGVAAEAYSSAVDDIPSEQRRVRFALADARWLPISSWQGKDEILIDMNPASAGDLGQVIRGGYENDPQEYPYAKSITAFIARMVDLGRRGELDVIDAPYGGIGWGIGPQADSIQQLGEWFVSPEIEWHYPDWVGTLEMPWREYFLGHGPGYVELFTRCGAFASVPTGATTLEPLVHAPRLSRLDLRTFELPSVELIPGAAPLLALFLGEVGSLNGIERFPHLQTLWIRGLSTCSLAPVADLPALAILAWSAPQPDAATLATCVALKRVEAVVAHDDDLAELLKLSQVIDLTISFQQPLDIDAPDWSGMTDLQGLSLDGAADSSLRLLVAIPTLLRLSVTGTDAVTFSALAQSSVVKLFVRGVREARDLAVLGRVDRYIRASVEYPEYLRASDEVPPVVWDWIMNPPPNEEGVAFRRQLQADQREFSVANPDSPYLRPQRRPPAL